MVTITDKSIDIERVQNSVADPGAGGIVVFVGTTRDNTNGRPVVGLEFEAYTPMAVRELEKIERNALEMWPVRKITVVHAVGRLEVGDPAVVIAVSAPHRDAAFKACRYIIDTLKKTVPIWKKEIFSDGEVWVNAHP